MSGSSLPRTAPEEVIGASRKAVVLSVSDNHANVLLLRSSSSAGDDIDNQQRSSSSLLKMNVAPSHRDDLKASPHKFTTVEDLHDDDAAAALIDERTSKTILRFLKNLDFQLTSESGAEYSYYSATEKSLWGNPFAWFFSSSTPRVLFKVEMISPASDRQIERSLPAPSMALVEETPDLYERIVQPYIEKLTESGSLSWIQNVLDGTKEVERLLLNTDDFILNVDTKWKSHPDPLTIPREEWRGHSAIDDLYCLAIVKDAAITSLRDLRGDHIPLLKSILNDGRDTIASVYGVSSDQLRVFVHYQPQFYHFHVHFTRLENEIGCQVERGHLLLDIIQNLELDTGFYAKRTICYKMKTTSELFRLIHAS